MSVVTLKAHFDGEQIRLDEPYELKPESKLIVTVLPDADESLEEERAAWRAISQAALARAYGEDEPDYSDAIILEQPSRE